MTTGQSHFNEIEQVLREVLNEVGEKMPDRDRNDVVDYLDHGEYGVAYELLGFVLDHQKIARPPLLVEVGKRMGIAD